MDPDSVRTTERVPHGGETDQAVLDCSANVNPRTPSGIEAVYREALAESRRYPADTYPAFRRAAAEYVGCDPAAVVPTAGGLAAIRLAISVTVEPGDDVLLQAPSFGEYAREVRLQGGNPRFVPHDTLLETEPAGCALAIVCTPNNPTGEAVDPDDVAAFASRCKATGTTVLVDEAFLGFTSLRSAATFDRENVIVARSLTKLFGLPGLRAGFAVATGEHGAALTTARRTWSLGTPAANVGAHCMRDDAFVTATRELIERERERLRAGLSALGFDVWPSDAPFVLVGCDDPDAILERARENGLVFRDARTFRRLDSHVRIAVRDHETTDRVLEVLADG